jgi:hypothetical protein
MHGESMSRMRMLATVTLLATTALLVPASAASAATTLAATIVCDAETGAITTSVAGPLYQAGAPRQVTVEFQRRDAVNVSLDARTTVPPLATPFKVTVSTKFNGSISATGYTGSFNPATSLYYQETVDVTIRNAAGAVQATRSATCRRDLRTTLAITCDQAMGTLIAGVQGSAAREGVVDGRPAGVRYRVETTFQVGPDDPLWRQGSLGGWDYDHRITPAADGTWADTGFTRTVTVGRYHYYAVDITVGVFSAYGWVVGGGVAKCVLADASAAPQG